MAADSDGTLTAVVICEGNLHDPEFPKKFRFLLGKLKAILQQPKSKKLKVNKVEPWNSVRVTLSIPKDAAARLRQLASEGSNALRALGILSVQLEGDSVISLRLAGQEIVLRTDNNPAGCAQEAGSSSGLSDLSRMLAANPMQTAGPSCSTLATPNNPPLLSEPIPGPSRVIPQSPAAASSIVNLPLISGPNYDKPPIFKSPNTICPMDGKLPAPPITNIVESREYPFESMTQARVIQRRENTMAVAAALGVNQTQLPSQSTSVPSSPQPIVVAGPGQGMVIGQIPQIKQVPQPPPPLAIPTKPLVVSQQQSLTQDQSVKSQFVQPPPPPYPTAVNSLKSSLSLHQANTITLPGNPSLSSNSNNIAISSPLLVNLLQNDGVNQVKPHQQTVGVQKPSVVIPQHQSMPSPLHQTIISNIKSPQQNDIMLNSPGVNHLPSGDSNVMMQSGQIIVNNNGVMNPNSVSTNISLNPSMPVPSSLTISNISTHNANQPSPHNATSPASAIGQSPQAIVNSNLIGQIPPNINIRMQQHQSRFPLTTQQQHILLRQQQIIPSVGGPIQRFPQQNQSPQQQILSPPSQQQFRHPPVQQTSPQRQQYVTPPPSPHPNAIVMNQNISLQSSSVVLNHPQQQQQQPPQMQQQIPQQIQQQMLGTSYNHPRWPFKPMDSATKSSFQEFTRYQMQYNLQQQLNQTSGSVVGTSSPDKSCLDPIGLGLSDLDELTKNDLESLLPNLNANDLDTALGLDGKNALESLLDEKDLDLDLIGQDISSFSDENLLEVALGPALQDNNGNEPSNVFQGIDSALTSSGKQRQYLINPLTGELEPMPSEESDNEPENIEAFNEFNSEISNSLFSDDENSCSTAFSKASDHSDTERSTNSEASSRSRYSKNKKDRKDLIGGAASGGSSGSSNKKAKLGLKGTLLREKLQQGIREKLSGKTKAPREKSTKVKLVATPLSENKDSPAEKIKLRLKLEKSEPVTPAYKVDISFVQSPKRAQTAVSTSTSVATALTSFSSTSLAMTPSSSPIAAQLGNSLHTSTSHHHQQHQQQQQQQQQQHQQHQQQHHQQQQSPAGEELRVPPLHISLRGKNSIIIKNSKKDRKKSQSGGEEDEYFKKSQLKRNHNSYEDAATISRIIQSTTEEMVKNNHLNRVISQGKPTTRQSSEDFLLGQINSNKLMSPPNQILENGGDMDNFGDKTNQTSKRNASDFVQCPNGLICPDTKRRRMSQTVLEHQLQLQHNQQLQQQQQMQQDNLLDLIGPYSHLKGPIGSTNVGTLPQHLNLSKNQKGSNNNISQPFNIKSGKNVVKSGKPLAVVKSSKSSTSNPVKDPGKSPPVILQITTSTTPAVTTAPLSLQSTISSLTSSSASDIKQSIMKGSSKITNCLLPQGTTDSVSQEKFKQKLLEFQNSEKIIDSGTVVKNNTTNTQTVELQSVGHNNQCNKSPQNDIISPSIPEKMTPPPSTLSTTTKSTNSVEDLGDNNNKIDKFRESECAKSHNNNRPPEDIQSGQVITNQQTQQQQQQQQQDTPPNASPSTTRISTSDNTGTPGSISTLTSNSSNPNVRSSPGSQAQGEDSGIESMDALSEKSPHQSASPQQGDQGGQKQPGTVHIKHDNEEKPTLIETKDIMVEEITNISDIEAALAKMEGINEHFLTPCESPSQKFNGDLTMKDDCLLQNLTDDKVSVQVFCAPKIEQDLTDIIIGTDDDNKPKLECRDLNENKEINSKISLETQLIDECCKKSLKPNIKLENEDIVVRTLQNSEEKKLDKCVIELTEIVDVKSEDIKQEQPQIKEEPHDVTSSEETATPTLAAAATTTKDNLILKEVLAPISIDIPTQSETDAHRIRTRASSKLESPLDFSKQSPQLDSPANSLKSNLRLSSGGTIERLSPKVNAGKGLTGTGKRKRQGSESSTQSCVSDDTPNKGASGGGGANSNSKRCRQNNNINNGGNGESVNNNSTKITSNNTKRGASSESCISGKGNQTKTKKNDESSDSDEPLIEVVGKVRNTKVTGKAHLEAEKVLRNHRGAQMKSTTASAVTNTSNNLSSNAAKTSRSSAAAATSIAASSLSTQTGGGNVPLSSTNTQTTNSSHATRGTNQVTINLMDDKIGTRRSVRASAAANKMIYSKNTLSETPKNAVNKLNSPTIAEVTDARRKTRSAAGTCNETLTEGRRRRGSRDSK